MPISNENSAYEIRWSKKATNYLLRLDRVTKERIVSQVEWLAEDPHSSTLDVCPIVGNLGLFRLRVGKYRVIFTLEEEIRILSVVLIQPRGEVYKHL